jgi:hypothetical protein
MSAETPQETPEERLYAAGFGRQLEWWVPPCSDRAMTLEAALTALESGEIKPDRIPWPGADAERFPGLQPQSEEQLDRLLRPPPMPAPPWLPELAELVAEKLKPVVRAEIRAAMKAAAPKRATT